MVRRATLSAKGKVDKSSIVTDDDLRIFKLAATDVNYFTDYYMRTPTSGTYYRNQEITAADYDPERQLVWEVMAEKWNKESCPDFITGFAPIDNRPYNIISGTQAEPVFFQNHGWLWIPWQKRIHHAPQSDITIVSGFGAGKTSCSAMIHAVLAATIPNYRGFAIAPLTLQAMEVYTYLKNALMGTLYEERFVHNATKRPPVYVIQNSYVGESTIEFYSIEDDPEKVRTLEGDVAILDQAEKFDNLEEVERSLGSRLRGTIRGRPRINKFIWNANSGDNPELWYRYDMQDHRPDYYLSINPSSYDNPYLSKRDIEVMKMRVGGSEEEVEQFMLGKRPMGSGEQFSRNIVTACTDEGLNRAMDNVLKLPEDDPRREGFVHRKTQLVGTYQWEMPPEHHLKRDYIVISDPGQGDPPDRNSAIIMVFDVTDFPEKPMVLRAFNWIYGHGSYWPWVLAYRDYVERYRAQGRNAFDSTGTQKGFDELVFHEMGIAAEGMNMAAGGKALSINAAKLFMAKSMIKFPYIAHLSNQLTNYRLPDNKIRQDLVMCLCMAAAWARRLYYVELDDDLEDISHARVPGEIERHDRTGGDRYSRPNTTVR